MQAGEEGPAFLIPDRLEEFEPVRVEDFREEDFTGLAPVGAVGGPGHVGVVVGGVFAGGEGGPGGEVGVVDLEELFRHLGGGGDERW